MATVSSPEIVKDILRSRGKNTWGGEIDWKLIYSYKSKINDESLFALFDDAKYNDVYNSPFICDQVLLMENGYLTCDGAKFLGVNQTEFNKSNDGCGGKYYRTVIQVEILSNDPYEFISLEDVIHDIMNEDCSSKINVVLSEEITPKVTAQLLIEHGHSPAFLLSDEDLEDYGRTL